MSLRDECQGKWVALLTELGVDRRYLADRHGPCPICNEGRDRFRFDDKGGRGTWICNVCGAGDGFALLIRLKGWDFKQTAEEIQKIVGSAERNMRTRHERSEQSLRDSMRSVWSQGKPIVSGDEVAKYLNHRGIRLDEWPAALRTVTHCRYQGDPTSYHPAMVAKVSAPDGTPCQVHRTYLGDYGRKADVASPRRLMPGKVAKGAAIRLCKPTDVLGIAEGIETALSASILCSVPVWAAISTAMLMQWEPPGDVAEVIVFGDHDRKFGGQAAAYSLAHRLAARNVKLRVEMPQEPGDWNDVLMQELEAA